MLSVLIFAAMWESDTPAEPQQNWLAARVGHKQISIPTDSVIQTSQRTEHRVELESLVPVSFSTPQVEMVSVTGILNVASPLPPEIAPGRYRIVDSDGSVDSVLVNASLTGSQHPVEPRPVYTMQVGSRTRYFIRVESPATSSVATSEDRRVR